MRRACRIPWVCDKKDNVYMSRSVVKQVLNDLHEKAREKERRVTCDSCGFLYTPLPDVVRCPRCGYEKEEGNSA